MKFWNKRNRGLLVNFLYIICFLACQFGSFVISLNTRDTKLSYLANDLNDFYNNSGINQRYLPYVSLKKEGERTYNDLFQNFYYSDPTVAKTASFRMKLETPLNVSNLDGEVCYFHWQPTNSIGKKYNWGYYLDYGLFATYYKNEILPDREYLSKRFGADGFVFISDKFADKLLEKYQISSYEELILNKNYCLLQVELNGVSAKYSINNILYSTSRTGSRVYQLENNFCTYYGENTLTKSVDMCVELDFKSDIFGTKETLKTIYDNGYDFSKTEYNFYVFDKQSSEFQRDTKIECAFVDAMSHKNYDTVLIIFILALSFVPCVLFLILKKANNFHQSIIICFILLIIRFASSIFVFSAPLSNIYEIVNFVFISLLAYYKFRSSTIYKKIGIFKREDDCDERIFQFKL